MYYLENHPVQGQSWYYLRQWDGDEKKNHTSLDKNEATS